MRGGHEAVVRAITKLVKSFGCEVTDVVQGNHLKFYLNTPTGKQLLVCSRTASDARAMKNNATLIRGWCRK